MNLVANKNSSNTGKVEQKPAPKFHEGDIIKPKDGGHEPWQIMQVDMLDKKYRFKNGYVIHFSQEDNYELVEQKPTEDRYIEGYLNGINNASKTLKSTAWSEEDETTLNDIIMCGERHCYLDAENIAWLKSLKDRYTWKPKMEQLTVLSKAIELRPLCESDGTILMSLYYDLKKLTE